MRREDVAADEAGCLLKDLVFARWGAEGCEERSDTLKMVGGGRARAQVLQQGTKTIEKKQVTKRT